MRYYIINKILVLSVLLALIVNTSFSQKNFRPGYIIKNSGDTLFGSIDYKSLDKNPNVLVFNLNTTGTPTIYKPKDLIEFGVNKDVFVKGVINAETSKSESDTVFLQILFSGKKSLYYYKNSKGLEGFVINRSGKLELLVSSNYTINENGTYKVEKSKKYIEQLTSYLSDCSSKGLNLKHTQYSKNSFITLFDNYYKCVPSYNYYKTKKISTEFGAFIGASLANIEFTGEGPMGEEGEYPYDWLSSLSYGNSIKPSAGLFFNIILPWNQRKWSINNELMFSTYNFKGKYSGVIGPMQFYNSDYELGYSYLKINNLIRLTYPIGSFSAFLNGGISTGWAVVEKNKLNYEYHLNSNVDYYTRDFLDETRKIEHGFIIGSGIKYRKYSVEFRFETGDGMEVYNQLTSITKRYFVLIGYTF